MATRRAEVLGSTLTWTDIPLASVSHPRPRIPSLSCIPPTSHPRLIFISMHIVSLSLSTRPSWLVLSLFRFLIGFPRSGGFDGSDLSALRGFLRFGVRSTPHASMWEVGSTEILGGRDVLGLVAGRCTRKTGRHQGYRADDWL